MLNRSSTQARQGLFEIGLDVINVLNANGDSNHGGGDACGSLLVFAQLLVGRRGWMDDEGFGIPNVGQMARQLEAIDELHRIVESPL